MVDIFDKNVTKKLNCFLFCYSTLGFAPWSSKVSLPLSFVVLTEDNWVQRKYF